MGVERTEKMFEDIIAKSFQIWWKILSHKSKKLNEFQARSIKNMKTRRILIKLLKTDDKENILKIDKGKKTLYIQRKKDKDNIVDFLPEYLKQNHTGIRLSNYWGEMSTYNSVPSENIF